MCRAIVCSVPSAEDIGPQSCRGRTFTEFDQRLLCWTVSPVFIETVIALSSRSFTHQSNGSFV